VRTVLFYRDFRRFTGGHLKVWHYFQHVASSGRFRPRVVLSEASVTDDNPWARLPSEFLAREPPDAGEVLFLAGLDWRRLTPDQRAAPSGPIVNLIQHLRHADPANPRSDFLGYRAVRICVSREVETALISTHRVNGPILTIPAAVEVGRPPQEARTTDVLVAATKERRLGRRIAMRLEGADRRVDLIAELLPRTRFLERVARAKVGVMLPHRTEGFFLPALEAMALGTILVCPDCTANRSYCLDGVNCFRPPYDEDAIVRSAEAALASLSLLGPMAEQGLATAQRHSLEAERAAFLEVLDRIDELWNGK
jgi:glycosyltransferase involved in cell wall biosynthesis